MQSSSKRLKASALLFVAGWFMYVIICFTKTNYTALIASIVKEGVFTKTDSGLISAAFYTTFGISQIAGGRFTDKKPTLAITIGIVGSLIPNFILCFVRDFTGVCVLWSICGLMQFGTYSGVVKIINRYLAPEHKEKARTYIVLCIGIGGILSYAVVAPIYEWLGWAGVFGMDALFLAISLVLWIYALAVMRKLKVEEKDEIVSSVGAEQVVLEKEMPAQKKSMPFVKLLFMSGLIFAVILNLVGTMLSNGFKSWISTMMMECYEISPVWASMQTALVYFANIFGTFIIAKTFGKIKNEMFGKGMALAFCLPFYIVILFIGQVPAFVIIICSMTTTTVLYGVGRININISARVEKYGYSASFVSILNGFASFGVVLANGGFGILADNFGWNVVTIVLVAACAISVVGYVVGSIFWGKFKEKENL